MSFVTLGLPPLLLDSAAELSFLSLTFLFQMLEHSRHFYPPMNSSSQPLGEAYLEDIFSGLVSTELGPSPGPKGTGEGMQFRDFVLVSYSINKRLRLFPR